MGQLEPSTVEEALQSLLLTIVNALVDDPSSVEIRSEQGDGATCFRLSVSRSEVGKLIGKQGRTARAIRNILSGRARNTVGATTSTSAMMKAASFRLARPANA